MSIKDYLEINDIIIDEIEKLKITENEKELLYKLLHHEKQIHNSGKSQYQDQYKSIIEEMMLKMN